MRMFGLVVVGFDNTREADRLACPRSKRHAVRPWEHPGPCPKCGSLMDVGDMLLLWD